LIKKIAERRKKLILLARVIEWRAPGILAIDELALCGAGPAGRSIFVRGLWRFPQLGSPRSHGRRCGCVRRKRGGERCQLDQRSAEHGRLGCSWSGQRRRRSRVLRGSQRWFPGGRDGERRGWCRWSG
jgi:hypothetical protein